MASATPRLGTLNGRIALVTAGASGMGRASAVLFAAEGAHTIILDRDADAATKVVTDIKAAGGSAERHVVDLADGEAIANVAAAVSTEHPRLDVLFNHAGVPGPPGFDYDEQSWNKCMTLNLLAPMLLTKHLLPLLRKSTSPSIIFTSSVSGLVASPFSPLYAAAKGGVVQYMRSLAVLLGPDGIRANAICPGPTDTPMLATFFGGTSQDEPGVQERLASQLQKIPLRRLGTGDEIARIALFLASEASSYVTGLAVPADGGFLAA